MIASHLETLIDIHTLGSQDPEDRYLITGVTWQHYEALLARCGDSPGLRVTYLDGVLEIVSPSLRHENVKSRIGDLLLLYFVETDTDYYPKGSTTFRQQARRGGTEADESYCIGTDKAIPDLAIEIVLSSGGISKLDVYSRLKVPEVWFWQEQRLKLYCLREDSPVVFLQTHGYEPVVRSELLPTLDIALLEASSQHPNPLTAAKEFRQRLRAQLA